MHVSKVSFAVILAMTFAVSARSQDSAIHGVGQPPNSQLKNSIEQSQEPAKVRWTSPTARQPRLTGVRVSTEESLSRIELRIAALGRYSVGHLSNPDRLYVHLLAASVDSQLKTPQVAGQDPFVSSIQIGNNEDSVTRVVFNLKAPVNYRVSELPGGAGVIIELTGEATRGSGIPNTQTAAIEPESSSPRNVPAEKQALPASTSTSEVSALSRAANTLRAPLTTPSASSVSGVKKDTVAATNKRSVVAVGAFPSRKDLAITTSAAFPEARSHAALGDVEFPAAASEVPDATRKDQAKSDLIGSYPATASF